MFDWLGSYQFFVDVLLVEVLVVVSFYVVFQCGLLSLASVGLMAVGAYTASLLATELGWPVPLTVAAGAAGGGLVALAFGLPVLRLKGIYLALGSLALAQAAVVGIANFGFTGGARGIVGVPLGVSTAHLVAVLVAACAVLQLLHRSHHGRALRALRVDERTAEGLGVPALRYKTAAFAASGALAGLAGALEAHRTGFISPEQYDFGLLVVVLTAAIVGGSGHWAGPVLVTLALGAFRESLDWAGTDWENLLFGVLLIAVMLVAPNGLSDARLWRRLRRRPSPATLAAPRPGARTGPGEPAGARL